MRSVSAALLALVAAGPALACTNNNDWDYLMLVMQWPPTACMSQNFGCDTYSSFFTLHGLWPENFDGTYPCFCSSEAFDPSVLSPIRNDMDEYWASYSSSGDTSFWEHEWTKHGTCATSNKTIIPSQYSFFKDTLDLRAKFEPDQALASGGITPSDSTTYQSTEVLSVLTSKLGAKPVFTCDSKDFLYTMTVCIDRSFRAFDCPSSIQPTYDCSASLTFPATNKALRSNETSA